MNMLDRKIAGAVGRAGRTLSTYRGTGFADRAEAWAGTFHRALNNENYDMATNGELRVLRLIAETRPKVIFDVGANVGEWSAVATQLCPGAQIHAFEVVPSTFDHLAQNVPPQVILNSFGLSDTEGEITMHLTAGTADATACPIEGLPLHERLYQKTVTGKVRTGATYLAEQSIAEVDYLKIDVEGMDLRVIKGFCDDIRKVRALQFEYGIFNIGSHDLLADFCSWLTAHGFVVGKVFPRSVQFFVYDFNMETFHASNFVAVRKDEPNLIASLS